MYIKYMDFECTAMGSKSAESVNKLFEFVESLSHVWWVSMGESGSKVPKVLINYLKSLKVYCMFEGGFYDFNCIEQGSLILKNPKLCSKLQ